MKTFTAKPDVIEAILYDGENAESILAAFDGKVFRAGDFIITSRYQIKSNADTLVILPCAAGGPQLLNPGNYIVRHRNGNVEMLTPETLSRDYE